MSKLRHPNIVQYYGTTTVQSSQLASDVEIEIGNGCICFSLSTDVLCGVGVK